MSLDLPRHFPGFPAVLRQGRIAAAPPTAMTELSLSVTAGTKMNNLTEISRKL
jgi:hypothetical protein